MRTAGLAMAFGTAITGVATAQSTLRGIVVDAFGNAVPQAQVSIERLLLSATATPSGGFVFTSIPSGRFTVLTRALGFEPDMREISFNGRDSVAVEVRLRPASQKLDSVVVTAAPVKVRSPQMRALEDRRKAGFGRFILRDELKRRDNSTLGDVLRMTAGARLVRRPDACGGGFAIATTRGGDAGWQRWMSCLMGAPFPPACYLSVYLDGTRLWMSGTAEPPNIDNFGTNSLEAVEIYRGPAELPVQYQGTGSGCGAILLWTRTGESN